MSDVLVRVCNGWSHRSRLVAAGLVLGGVVSGGLLFATIPDQAGVLHGCYSRSGGTVRVIDNSVTTCKASETALRWNVTGPKGDEGVPGTPGAPGSPGDRGPSDAYVVDRNGNFSATSLNGATFINLVSMSLPAGSFVVNATGLVTGDDTFGVAQCAIRSPAGALGHAVQQTVGGAPTSFGTISVTAAFTLAVPDEVSLACRGSSSIQTQPSTMTAIQVQTLTDLSE
jgi:hypothetical protein